MREELPKISIVTPCLNAEKTIARTIDSILAQDYPNLEYLVCDGGSTDRTVEIVRARLPAFGRLVSLSDRGISDALNRGFATATGDVVCYLNADDALAAGALLHVGRFFSGDPGADVLSGACLRVFADGSEYLHIPSIAQLATLPYRLPIDQPSTFWRSSVHRAAGRFDESFKLALDWDWWNRLRELGATFAMTDKTLSVYYFSDTNLTSNGGMNVIREMARITARYAPRGRLVTAAYWLIFWLFDMRGYYDVPRDSLPATRKYLFAGTIRFLAAIFGRDAIHAYNWNWASKQVRGKVWYK